MTKVPLKVVVSGPVGAGKSTFIRTLSQTEVVDTDERSSENIGKTHTTVALDFGQIDLGDYLIHLFGTPGQTRFDFMWDILSEGALGLLLLVACDRPGDFPHARRILEFVTSRQSVPFIVVSTRNDVAEKAWQPADIAAYFDLPLEQVIAINAENVDSAKRALIRLMQQL
ncbi:MAG: ATP/GTP-binding protein [Nevskiaceae bacterium]|jgi:small GTP-binding protein|nr:ATP/GTP-binding protein [Nevskiaceae bacterium]